MDQAQLQQKARAVLKRRSESGIGYYLRTQWQRHVLIGLVFLVLTVAVWFTGGPIFAAGLLGLWAGRLMRDFQWYIALAKEWTTTRELIDWPRVEALAANSDL